MNRHNISICIELRVYTCRYYAPILYSVNVVSLEMNFGAYPRSFTDPS
jgi:hypothetical protein